MASPLFDVAIAGAGIMGLSCALEEARRGKSVAVFSPLGGETKASWAAAGILVSRDAHIFHSPFREFYVRSVQYYPAWLETVNGLAGTKVPIHRVGDYLIFDASTEAGAMRAESKRGQFDREHAKNYTLSMSLPPSLGPHSPLSKPLVFHFPDEAYVNNRDLIGTLRLACEKLGVTFYLGMPEQPWDFASDRTVFRLPAGRGGFEARQVILAAGAWTAGILEALGFQAPMIPVKGQMMRIANDFGLRSLVHFGDEIYLVPRGDGIVVGATTEAGVWNEDFDSRGHDFLATHLRRLLLSPGTALEAWSGLRPRTKDRLPWMGWLDAAKGWAICTGHYKCGISMAPLAALSLSKLLNGEKPPLDLAPFDPLRAKGIKAPPEPIQKNNS